AHKFSRLLRHSFSHLLMAGARLLALGTLDATVGAVAPSNLDTHDVAVLGQIADLVLVDVSKALVPTLYRVRSLPWVVQACHQAFHLVESARALLGRKSKVSVLCHSAAASLERYLV